MPYGEPSPRHVSARREFLVFTASQYLDQRAVRHRIGRAPTRSLWARAYAPTPAAKPPVADGVFHASAVRLTRLGTVDWDPLSVPTDGGLPPPRAGTLFNLTRSV